MKTEVLDLTALKEGKIVAVGNKLYGICVNCGKLVQINKLIFGSMHLCAGKE